MKGFVYTPVGGGGPLGTEAWKKANVKILTDFEQCGEISGFPIYEALLCQVTKEEKTQIHGQGETLQNLQPVWFGMRNREGNVQHLCIQTIRSVMDCRCRQQESVVRNLKTGSLSYASW